ncbi:TMEM175 family protein [Gordonia sp. OPL2]|uniref:TMEM175 family protein n=1 Tax=Gordonia sp. OPL2 TaxID=2486274 RepID=UPI00165573F4|nr:TMEM175 family protein [Gordonia sp. OPL2]RPA02559.1 DUF1211 domain-containing protein [Gordonia sp. OPL2]
MAGERQTEEGFRRLIAFSDAVVAIALTLLVLPLADIPEQVREDTSVSDVFSGHLQAIVSFLISFVVIWVLWRHHHRTMEHFRAYDHTLFELHFVWLLTIVVLPFVTALMDKRAIAYSNVLYIGVLAISILALLAMVAWGRRHPELVVSDDATDSFLRSSSGAVTFALLVVALVIAAIFPTSGVWPLLLLLLSGPIDGALRRVR